MRPFYNLLLISAFVICSVQFLHADTEKFIKLQQMRDEGYRYQEQGDYYQALQIYQNVIEAGYETAQIYNDLGIIYETIDFPLRAEEHYLKSIEIDPNYLPAYSNLAFMYKKFDNKENAIYYFRKRYELANNTDAWKEKAKQEVISLEPSMAGWFLEYEANALQQELILKAQEEFAQKVAKAKDFEGRADTFHIQRKFPEALAEIDKALTLLPNNEDLMAKRKEILLQQTQILLQEQFNDVLLSVREGEVIEARTKIRELISILPTRAALNQN